jgi:glycosyltransferase involved in cell wall biosynthesis
MSDAYVIADIVVLPSKSESFGYAALEALTLGIPTLLNDIPTFHEIADGNESACFFKTDARDLARLLETRLNEHYGRTTPNSEWIGRYSIDSWVKEYEELFV